MKQTESARQWLQGVVDNERLPRPSERAHVTKADRVHHYSDCITPGVSYATGYGRIVECSRCLTRLRDSGDAVDRERWAMHLVAKTLELRSHYAKADIDSLATAYDETITREVCEVLSTAPNATDSQRTLFAAVADALRQQCLPAQEYREKWHARVAATALLWGCISNGEVTDTTHIMMVGTILPDGLLQAACGHRLASFVHRDETGITSQLVNQWGATGWGDSTHPDDWSTIVSSLTREWSSDAQYRIDHASFYAANQAPNELQLQRSDFPTTDAWLQAEYRLQIKQESVAALATLRDMLLRYHPTHYRCWVTVTPPRKALKQRSLLHHLAWYQQASAKGKTLTQLPFTVLAMLCRWTDTTLSEWKPVGSDPMSQSTLEAALALLVGDDRPARILSVWKTACAVTGADEDVVYGSPDLTAVPRRARKKRPTPAPPTEPLFPE